MYGLKDKVVIITGAAKGIGKATTQKFAQENANIIAIDMDDVGLSELVEEIKNKTNITGYALDVTDYEKVNQCIVEVLEKYSQIHVLVNNAGARLRKNVDENTIDDWTKILNVNVISIANFCDAVLPSMVEHRSGKIINVGSIISKSGETTSIPYSASKGAVSSYTKSMAKYYAPYQIYFNSVAPHAIDSDFIGYWDDEKREKISNSIPLKRLGTPQDVANVILFLASGESNFIVGENININGGYYMD